MNDTGTTFVIADRVRVSRPMQEASMNDTGTTFMIADRVRVSRTMREASRS